MLKSDTENVCDIITISKLRDGEKGDKGDDGITYRIESSAGFVFDTNTETEIKALIYSGGEEIDSEGNLNYTWYARKSNDTDFYVLATGKIVTVFLTEDMQIYFETTSFETANDHLLDELTNNLTDEFGNRFIF